MRVLILDIDGTLNTFDPKPIVTEAVAKGYEQYGTEVWNLFEDSTKDMSIVPHAIPYKHYEEIVSSYQKVIIITSRLDKWRTGTVKWLKKWGFHYDDLYMRLSGTERIPSRDLKRLYVDHLKKRWKIKHFTAIDDDLGVLDFYRSCGMLVFRAPEEWEKALSYHRRINTLKDRRKEKCRTSQNTKGKITIVK
jgi:hypothetical protein